MAKLQPYKLVNPGASSITSPAVAAARTQTLAFNRLGTTVSSLSSLVGDLGKISTLTIKSKEENKKAERRDQRREKDSSSETKQEAKALKKEGKDKKSKLGKKVKKGTKGIFGWIEKFLGPIGDLLLKIAVFSLGTSLLKYLSDPDNVQKIKTFLDKALFVFDKLKGFATSIYNAFTSGLDWIFGKESTIGERLEAFGKIALAIGGIAGMLAAVSGVRDLLQPDLPVDPPDPKRPRNPDKPDKPRKPTRANPSGADPDIDGPNKRPKASTILDKYGDLAERQYKKILAERGDEAAKAFANALNDSGGNITQATKKFNRLLKKGAFKPIEPPKPGALTRIGNFFGGALDTSVDLGKRGLGALHRGLKGLPDWAGKQYGNLSKAAKAGWENTVKATQFIAEKGKKWSAAAGNAFKGGLESLGTGAKNFFLEKILTPLKPIIDPIANKAKKIGQGMFDMLKKLPGMDKATEILKKKGIASFGDVATAGSKLGKRAAAILPVVGGIVNLAFAYDRAANGDSIGALIEGTSGILDVAGLATAGAGNVASMLLDGYMFVRDFVPQLQEGEEGVVDAIGARGLKTDIDKVLSKLPNIGEIINTLMGKAKEDEGQEVPEQEMFLGGVVKSVGNAIKGVTGGIGKAVSGVMQSPIGQVLGTAASFIPGAAPIMAGINTLATGNPMAMLGMIPGMGGIMGKVGEFMSGPIGQIASNVLTGNFGGALSTGLGMLSPSLGGFANSVLKGGLNPMNMIQGAATHFGLGGLYNAVTGAMGGDMMSAMADIAGQIGVDPKVIGGVKDVASQALSEGGISAEYAMNQALDFIPIPVILEKLVPIPTAVPINNGGGEVVKATPSSITTRSQ